MPRREERDESQGQQHGAGAGRAKEKPSKGGPTSSAEDLKKREYRDKQGKIHHHTHTSEEQKEHEKDKE
jgi:hypothetical protein